MATARTILATALQAGHRSFGYGELRHVCGSQEGVFDVLELLAADYRVEWKFSRGKCGCFAPLQAELIFHPR